MESVFVIFALGVVVSLVVAKGVMQANEFANEELEKLDVPARDEMLRK
jgi:hypothetical protein